MRTRLLPIAVLLLLSLADSLCASERPNILLILCDDLGYGDLGCYGNPTIRTPRLDHLASEGLRFTDFYSAAPVCSPARVGLLTGRTPNRVGVYDWIPAGRDVHLRAAERTIPQLLKEAGYDTCLAGKWHCNGKFNQTSQPQPDAAGFDHWFATQNNAAPTHENPRNFVRNGQPVGETRGFSCQIVAREATDWLRRRQQENDTDPFFLYVAFHEPHEPIASPEDLIAAYPQATKRGEALYYANVTNMDRAVGHLMDGLDELQLRDNTLVIFTSDNGPETLNRYKGSWRSHGTPGRLRGMKLHTHEAGIRVCGLMRWPGHIEAGTTSAEPVCSVDFLPTFCELAGVDTPADRTLDGTNFLPALAGLKIPRQQPLFWCYYASLNRSQVAIRDGQWKLLGQLDSTVRWNGLRTLTSANRDRVGAAVFTSFELYDLSADTSEQRDLADSRPDLVQQLAPKLKARYRSVLGEGHVWPAR